MKLYSVLAIMMVVTTFLATTVIASPYGVIENDPITVPNSAPTIDGNIGENEGWSTSALMNNDTLIFCWAQQPLTMDGNVRFAWDENYLYYCANIVEGLTAVRETDGIEYPEGYNTFIYSTGEDNIDVSDSEDELLTNYGYNGDIFGLIIDPLGAMLDEGYLNNKDYTPMYMIGLFEGDVAKMYRQCVNHGDITDQVLLAGHKTDTGWCFEAALPWDMIIRDISDITDGICQITKSDLYVNNALIRVGAMYHDRFIDEETGDVATWGRFLTAPTNLADGWQGQDASGPNVKTCGIQLHISSDIVGSTTSAEEYESAKADGSLGGSGTSSDSNTNSGGADNNSKNNSSASASNGSTASTTKAASTGSATGGDSAQTFDIGIGITVGTLAVSTIGYVATKKRK